MAENVLELKNLNVKFELEEDTVEAVNGISIHLDQGETLGLVGETGAGKTTTALSLLRLIDSPPGVMECDNECIRTGAYKRNIGVYDLSGSDDFLKSGVYCGTADCREHSPP